MRLEILLTAAFFYAGTCLSGYALRRVLKLKKEGLLFSVLSGVLLWWALMELILVPMTIRLESFRNFTVVYSAAVGFCMLAGVFCRRELWSDLRALPGSLLQCLTLGHLVALALVCYQLYFIHHHMYLEWDDTYYVNLANEAVRSDRIYWVYPETGGQADFDKRYVLSLWPIFYAWLSRLTGVLPTIMAHTILPWIMIPAACLVYLLTARELFPEDRQLQGMFLALAALVHLFMSGVHVAGITFLSITPWVGKGVLASVLLPALFCLLLRTARQDDAGSWVLLGIACLGGCLLSSMGILLTPVFVGGAVLLLALHKRSIRYLLCGAASCMPCVALGIYYIYLTH